MKVKTGESNIDRVRSLIRKQQGTIRTSDLKAEQISREYLAILEKRGEIQRVARGVYVTPDTLEDDMLAFQATHHRAIFSHETALFLHGLSDRTPLAYTVTVPSRYNATNILLAGIKVFYVKKSLYPLGLADLKSPFGHLVHSYNLERTIVDLVRNRRQIDAQILTDALKRYTASPEKNLNRLSQYAGFFQVGSIVRQYLEVLL